MSNEFLCRGKRVDTHRWVDGYYVKLLVNAVEKAYLHLIIGKNDGEYNSVNVETVGRCTGLVNKNGLTIFEGDILRHDGGTIHEVVFEQRNGNAYFGWTISEIETWHFDAEILHQLQVIGNIHDNPELMGGTENEH